MKFVRLTFLEDGVINISKKEIVAVSSDPDSSQINSIVWLKSGNSFAVKETHSTFWNCWKRIWEICCEHPRSRYRRKWRR